MSAMLIAPGEGRKANWKASQGPTKSIVSAPRPMTKATGILPWAGGTSLAAATADGLGGCWLNASPGKEMKMMKTIDSLFSLLYIDAAYIRAANPVPRRFRPVRKLAVTDGRTAPAPPFMKLRRFSRSLACLLCSFIIISSFLLIPRRQLMKLNEDCRASY